MNKELRIKNRIKKAGFTLVETLVAIAILVIAIVGPLTIASNSLNSAYYASDQVTAFYLAQEGIEYARFLRDYNFINQAHARTWDQGIKDACTGVLCRLDPINIFTTGTTLTSLSVCASVSDCNIQKDSNGVFRQVVPGSDPSMTATNFYRTITVTPVSGVEDRVVVNIYWTTANLKSPNNFQIAENLFNWDSSIGSSSSVPTNILNVTLSGTGVGTVTDGSINCSPNCSTTVPSGTAVTLSANPVDPDTFLNWTVSPISEAGAGCSDASGTCIVTVSATTTVNAQFKHGKTGGGGGGQ